MVRVGRKQTRKAAQTPQMALDWMQVMLHGRLVEQRQDVTDVQLRRRMVFITAGMIIASSILAVRLFDMQVVAGQKYRNLANNNRFREQILYAPRGKILDRNGAVLADNTLSFQLSMVPYELPDDDAQETAVIKRASALAGIKQTELEKLIDENGHDYVLPVPIELTLTHERALKLLASADSLPGFSIDRVPSRTYDASSGLAHVVGYIGRVSEEDVKADKTGILLPTDFIGKTGVEESFDERLRGQNGFVRYEVDALGRPVRVVDQTQPIPGEDIHLSIDLKTQKTMAAAVQKQMTAAHSSRASGVAVDPDTGEIFALVSLPSYDNNKFIGGISHKDFNYYNTNPNQPLFNKVIGGGFTSGSIIKPLVASAALQEGIVNENTVIVDSGYIDVQSQYGTGSFRFRGWRPGGLGPMNVRSALAWSSNIYFYTVGGGHDGIEGLGEARLNKYYRAFGLGEATGIDLPGGTEGRVPNETWKLANTGEPWYVGDSFNIAIGQGDLLISPLQITMAEVAIANNGRLLKPQIESGTTPEVRRTVPVDTKYLQIVREGMRQVLGGTTCECVFKDVGKPVAGKSGTAETNTPNGRPPHAWFTAFAPYSQEFATPDILATVLIEEGVGGSQYAAPAIAETFKTFFKP